VELKSAASIDLRSNGGSRVGDVVQKACTCEEIRDSRGPDEMR
jgi:hypothetical protein